MRLQANKISRIKKKVREKGVFELCERSRLLQAYYELNKYGEICPHFNLFSILVMLGAVVNRKVFFQRGSPDIFPTLYPNPWVILVAPQGVGHKSSSLRTARYYVAKLPEHARPRIFATKITPEALVKVMASQIIPQVPATAGMPNSVLRPASTGLIYSSELSTFLGRERYSVGMADLLTDLYDCQDEWNSETIMRGDQRLYNVCLSLCGGITPDKMQELVSQGLVKSGFMSRLIFVPFPSEWYAKEGDPPPSPKEAQETVVEELYKISQIRGEMKWTPEARELFIDWYENETPDPTINPVMAYFERKQDHVLKISILLQLTYTYNQLLLEESTLRDALNILNIIEPEIIQTFQFILTEPKMRGAHLILDILRKYKEIGEDKLLQLCWNYLSSPIEFDHFIPLLLKAKLISIVSPSKIGGVIRYKLSEQGKKGNKNA